MENLCGYAQRDLAVPLLTEAAIDGTAVDVRAANAAAKAWCAEVNAAVHSEICAVPDERLLVEREVLQPLPSLRLQIGAPSVLRKVDRLVVCPVCLGPLLGAHPADRHHRGRGGRSRRGLHRRTRDRDDRGRTRTRRPRDRLDPRRPLRRAPPGTGPRATPENTIEKQFCALGEDAEAFLVGAAAIGNTRLGSELEILLALGAAHGEQALVAALRRAVAFRRFRAADVRSILAAGAGTPQPRPAGDALILDLPVAPTRSLDAYKITTVVDGGVTFMTTTPDTNSQTRCTAIDSAAGGRSGCRVASAQTGRDPPHRTRGAA